VDRSPRGRPAESCATPHPACGHLLPSAEKGLLHPVIFADYRPTAAGLAWAPVFGLFEVFQAVELADFFQAFVNQLPGARTVGTDFASVFAGTAARAVHHFLRTPCDGTDAAVEMQHTFAAGRAFFRPDSPFLQNADERGVEPRVNGFAAVTKHSSLLMNTVCGVDKFMLHMQHKLVHSS